ncbi:MAG: hypothetical protein EOP92_06325 [Lysobacteraceae bacterium]|nr:MAG: hypothetical protein EOP92_06325 [Xanthomonadaceae bacterium]
MNAMIDPRGFELAGKKAKLVVALFLLSLALTATFAMMPPDEVALDGAMRTQAIDKLVAELNAHYVFPSTAKQIETLLRKRQQDGKYDAISNGMRFASQLTSDMASVANDKHMKVRFSPRFLHPDRDPESMASAPPSGKSGVDKVGRLTPSIGYLRLSSFPPPSLVAEKYASVMNTLSDTDALIIDVRDHRGGSPQSVALLISYFVDQRTRLNDIWSRDSGQTRQFWTEDRLDGKRYGGKKPVMILAGPRTGSAGEDFTYTMQALKRATVIGEPTWGGAHPVASYRLSGHFYADIPNSRSMSPITHTNWEGTGVKPDIATPQADALGVAKNLLQRQHAAR